MQAQISVLQRNFMISSKRKNQYIINGTFREDEMNEESLLSPF